MAREVVKSRYKDDGTIDQFFSKLAIEDSKTRERLYSPVNAVSQPQQGEASRSCSLKLVIVGEIATFANARLG